MSIATPSEGVSSSVIIHTDGACHGNPGPGGWAAVLVAGQHRKELSGAVLATTNNRMELQAAIEALIVLKRPCEIAMYTDSNYLRQGVTEWIHGWRRNGWKTKAKKPVKNADLWRQLDEATRLHRIKWHWLKGHAGHAGNERCDNLATEAILALKSTRTRQEFDAALREFVATTSVEESTLV